LFPNIQIHEFFKIRRLEKIYHLSFNNIVSFFFMIYLLSSILKRSWQQSLFSPERYVIFQRSTFTYLSCFDRRVYFFVGRVPELNSPSHRYRSAKLFSVNATSPKGTVKLDGRLLFNLREVIKFPHVRRRLYFTWYQKERIVATKCPADSGEQDYRPSAPCMAEANRRECIVLPLVPDGDDVPRVKIVPQFSMAVRRTEKLSVLGGLLSSSAPRDPQFPTSPTHFQPFRSLRQHLMYAIKLWFKFV